MRDHTYTKEPNCEFTMWIARDKHPPKDIHLKMLGNKFIIYPSNLTTCYEPHVKAKEGTKILKK